jgi:uncharacterized membrane protein YedE/YeeE
MNIPTIKRWAWVSGCSLIIGILIGTQSAYYSIIKDCKVMGMFRYGDAPMSCTYHLVIIQEYKEPVKEDKKKK